MNDGEGNIIGEAIESYQGGLTVQVLGDVIRSERLIETLKTIEFSATERLYHLIFRLRSGWADTQYIDVDQYIRVVRHSATGNAGAP